MEILDYGPSVLLHIYVTIISRLFSHRTNVFNLFSKTCLAIHAQGGYIIDVAWKNDRCWSQCLSATDVRNRSSYRWFILILQHWSPFDLVNTYCTLPYCSSVGGIKYALAGKIHEDPLYPILNSSSFHSSWWLIISMKVLHFIFTFLPSYQGIEYPTCFCLSL